MPRMDHPCASPAGWLPTDSEVRARALDAAWDVVKDWTMEEREELRNLRKENNQLKLEREILKKAAAYFAKTLI